MSTTIASGASQPSTAPAVNSSLWNDSFVIEEKNGATYIRPRTIDPTMTELKIGVLLPFHQHGDEWTKQLTLSGTSAIRMAAQEINTQKIIPGAYVTLVEMDSYPKEIDGQEAITQAVYAAISLIQDGVVGIIGDISSSWTSLSALMTSTLQIPQCSFTAFALSLSDKSQFGYFFRTVPTELLYADASLAFVVSQGWPALGVLYSDTDSSRQLTENLIMKAKLKGVLIKVYQKFYEKGPESDIRAAIKKVFNEGAQIVFVAADGDAQLAALVVAAQMGYINNDTVWIARGSITKNLEAAVARFNRVIEHRASSRGTIDTIVAPDNITTTTKTKSTVDPVIHAAQTATNLTPIDYNATFAGGVFLFDTRFELPGYPPYESFLDKWSQLNPQLYPYAGHRNTTSNEGLAYSCAMVMANGFSQVISNATNTTLMREKLASGQLGEALLPSAFNTSYVGPSGPMIFDENGDVILGNFVMYNIQRGVQQTIGHILEGKMNLILPPLFHDGTNKPPSGSPTRVNLNPGFSSPTSIVMGVVAGAGILIALVTMIIVILFRKRNVFRASSPLFCVLELLGFICSYISVFFYTAYRSKLDCILIPVTFHLGFSLVIGNLIAKNYRIYRIFNNVFITKTVVTDLQLLKVSGGILLVDTCLLISWLCTGDILLLNIPVSNKAYYVACSYQGPGHSIIMTLLTAYKAGQLAFAIFLAFKTRAVGKNYAKYSEHKQIGISVYNIFFSALIGFVIYSVPATDYYTRHYLTTTTIIWATTFSLLVLFVPKLVAFFKQEFRHADQRRPASSHPSRGSQMNYAPDTKTGNTFRSRDGQETFVNRELVSLNHLLADPNAIDSSLATNNMLSMANQTIVEAHEARMPVQVIFRYFPFLSTWDMKHIFLFPRAGYFSFFSEKSNKGHVFAYSRVSTVSAEEGSYVLRVHGTGLYDVLIQVANQTDLHQWTAWFASKGTASSSDGSFLSSSKTCLASSSTARTEKGHSSGLGYSSKGQTMNSVSPLVNDDDNDDDDEDNAYLSPTKTLNNDSDVPLSQRRLLLRQGSGTTMGTVDSCYFEPMLTEHTYPFGGFYPPTAMCSSSSFGSASPRKGSRTLPLQEMPQLDCDMGAASSRLPTFNQPVDNQWSQSILSRELFTGTSNIFGSSSAEESQSTRRPSQGTRPENICLQDFDTISIDKKT